MSDIQYGWLGAEGEIDGTSMLLRVREIPDEDLAKMPWQQLLVVSILLENPHVSGLPTAEQYDVLSRLEDEVIDGIEDSARGILAFMRTMGGTVQYFFYVADIDEAVSAFSGCKAPGSVEFAGDDENRWEEYRSMRSELTGL